MNKEDMEMLPCPACGFETIKDVAYGSYELCDICGWEDDGVQLANPCSGGGANGDSLVEAQAKALKKYPLEVDVANGYKRSQEWRPLDSAEMKGYEVQHRENHWVNMAIVNREEAYWVNGHNPSTRTK